MGEGGEKNREAIRMSFKRKTNYTRADLYCVRSSYCQHSSRSVFIFNSLLSEFLFISGTHASLWRFSFRNLVFWYSIPDTPALKIFVSIMVRLITSGRENSPTTTNPESTEIEPIYHWFMISCSIVRPPDAVGWCFQVGLWSWPQRYATRWARRFKAGKGAMMK